MLFLLDNQVLELELPERRLAKRWRTLGCGDPMGLRAREAVAFARDLIDAARHADEPLPLESQLDLAALIVAKTGANAAQFIPSQNGPTEPRLHAFDESVIALFRTASEDEASPWKTAVA